MVYRLTREELYELVWSKPMSVLAKELGISDVGRPYAPPDIVLIDGEEYSKRSVTYRWLPFVLFGAGFIAGVFFTVILYS